MTPAPAFGTYEFAGCKELCLCPSTPLAHRVMLVPPLFDEMNRMRRMLVGVLEALEGLSVGGFLPDLPGTNESQIALDQVTLSGWQDAMAACAQQHGISHIASFRAGVLAVAGLNEADHWIFSPAKGAAVLRTMLRTKVAADRESGLATSIADLTIRAEKERLELAGNIIGPKLFAQLNAADIPSFARQQVIRLESDSKPADSHVPGSALWLRAEPDDDPAMSSAIARNIAAWMTR